MPCAAIIHALGGFKLEARRRHEQKLPAHPDNYESSGNGKVELRYASGISHPINRRWDAGVEFFGNWTEHEHFVGPTLSYRVSRSTKILLNAGFKYLGD